MLLSIPVAAVAGLSTYLAGHLSGFALGLGGRSAAGAAKASADARIEYGTMKIGFDASEAIKELEEVSVLAHEAEKAMSGAERGRSLRLSELPKSEIIKTRNSECAASKSYLAPDFTLKTADCQFLSRTPDAYKTLTDAQDRQDAIEEARRRENKLAKETGFSFVAPDPNETFDFDTRPTHTYRPVTGIAVFSSLQVRQQLEKQVARAFAEMDEAELAEAAADERQEGHA